MDDTVSAAVWLAEALGLDVVEALADAVLDEVGTAVDVPVAEGEADVVAVVVVDALLVPVTVEAAVRLDVCVAVDVYDAVVVCDVVAGAVGVALNDRGVEVDELVPEGVDELDGVPNQPPNDITHVLLRPALSHSCCIIKLREPHLTCEQMRVIAEAWTTSGGMPNWFALPYDADLMLPYTHVCLCPIGRSVHAAAKGPLASICRLVTARINVRV